MKRGKKKARHPAHHSYARATVKSDSEQACTIDRKGEIISREWDVIVAASG